jgi:general secretion pathway protein F
MTGSGMYAYRAARRDGAIAHGVVEAMDRSEASSILSDRGLFPIEVRLEAEAGAATRRLSARDAALGLRVLASLLESGLSMSRALQALDDLAPPSWRTFLPVLREAVREGKSLASALSGGRSGLPPVVIGMIAAGEAGGGVASGVRRAADLMEGAAATRAAMRGALAYPLLLAVAGTASLALLVGLVIPRFSAILADLGQTLPATTRLVLTVTSLVREAGLPLLIATFTAVLAWRMWTAGERGLAQWHRLLEALPVVGTIRRSAATARLTAAWAGLLESGVPVAIAMRHAAAAGGDMALAARIAAARIAVINGSGIARALESERALTPTAIRLIRTGEETGRLAEMLAQAAGLEAERAERRVRATARLLEPGLILVFGAVVAFVSASLLQAVYSIRPIP